MTPALEATFVQILLFAVSLLGSYIVFNVLKSTARVQHAGVQLGGAVAGFGVMFAALNHYSAEFREHLVDDIKISREAEAAQSVKALTPEGVKMVVATVALSRATQRVATRDLDALDRNDYLVETAMRFAFARPHTDRWQTGKVSQIGLVGVYDIPGYQLTLGGVRMTKPIGGPDIFAIRSRQEHNIVIVPTSRIETIPATFNMFAIPEYATSLQQSIEMMSGRPAGEVDPMAGVLMQKIMAEKTDELIKRQFPVAKKVVTGIYIIAMSADYIRNTMTNRIMPKASLLDAAYSYFMLSEYTASGTWQNIYSNHERQLMSFDGSVLLQDVEIDGASRDAILNVIGFMLDLDQRVVAVELVYLSTDPVESFVALREILESLQFAP